MSSSPRISQAPPDLNHSIPCGYRRGDQLSHLPLTEIWPCWPAGSFCPSSQKSGCHCGGCSLLSDITSIVPLIASCLHQHLSPLPHLVCLSQWVHPHHPHDLYKSRK